jgi:hypothetical protein
MQSHYDVIVFGGGTAGVCAAAQAGRAGARTLLVEKTGQLGGTMTSGGISAPASFHAWGRQVIAGIGWEWVTRTLALMGREPEDPGERMPIHIYCNPALLVAVADELVTESGAELLFHAMPATAAFDGTAWRVALCTKTGLREVSAGALIDCTADANVVTLAGLPTHHEPVLQPGTMAANFAGYDAKAQDYPALQASYTAAVAAGELLDSDAGWWHGDPGPALRKYGGNALQVAKIDGTTSEGRTAAEIEGRRVLLRFLRWCRRQPGLEGFTVSWLAPECGVRETVTIVGKGHVTDVDYVNGRVYDDAVCYSVYPIDIHTDTGIDGGDSLPRRIERDTYPTIPLGALLPRDGRRLLAAGRCIAGDRYANSSYRVAAPCMAMGQAAGAAAALACRLACEPEEVPMAQLRALLREHGAVVPE